jgi:hypothetical protein
LERSAAGIEIARRRRAQRNIDRQRVTMELQERQELVVMESTGSGDSMGLSSNGAAENAAERRVRELTAFALRELPGMRLDDGMYCLEVHADDMKPRGRSIRYSVMTALGLLRARAAGYEVGVDVDALVDLILAKRDDPALKPGDAGLLLWLDRRAGRDHAGTLLSSIDRRLDPAGGWAAREGMEVAWIAIGASEAVAQGMRGHAERTLASARGELLGRRGPSGLLRHRSGWRGRFPNFATQIYGTLALATLSRRGDDEALAAARGIADVLLRLQRPDGGWPWLFDLVRGRVAEPYEVYAVHQDAMAPMGLFELYEATGDDRYRAAAARGLEWIYGRNDLGVPMLDEARNILYRSIRRKQPYDRAILTVNTAGSYLGMPFGAAWRGPLEINPTDRPYHLGWVLEAWAGREGYVSAQGHAS